MKSEPFRFSPTSAGVRAEHINFHNNNRHNCINNNCRSTFSLPRARVLPPSIISSVTARDDEEHQCLDQVVVQNSKTIRTEPLKKKRSSRMRNCLIFTGVVVIVSLLSFVLFVECRSITGVSKKHNNADVSPDSRIQDDSSSSSQEPSAESSEEFPIKVLSTTTSSKDFSSSKTTPKWSTSGRLTRSRVSVICKGSGAPGEITDSTPVIISTTKSTSRKANSKSVDLPTLLPRVSDSDDEFDKTDDGEGDWNDYDTTLSSGESQVVTVSGYSHVAGAKPETKSHQTSSIASIRYVPKSSPNHKAEHVANLDEDSIEIGDSSEETVIITVKPKSKSSHAKPRSKANATNHERRPAPTSSTMPPSSSSTLPTTSRSRTSRDKKNKQRREKNNRENNEEDTEPEEEKVTQEPRRKHSSSNSSGRKSSKRSRQGHSKDSSSTTTATPTTEKQEKGDSGELNYEEDSLFPTLATPRKSKGESRREGGRKSSKQEKTTTAAPANEEDSEDVESAEAEPIAIVEVRQSSSRKSSRSRKPKGGNGNKNKGTSPPRSTPSPDGNESSEEYNMEEMPFTDPSDSGRRKSRKSSNSYLSNLRMSSKTTAPKLRTRPFSSFENDD